MVRSRYKVPLIAFVIAALLTGTLLGADHLRRVRIDSRAAGTVPTQLDAASPLAALSGKAPAPTAAGLHAALDGFVRTAALKQGIVAAVVDVRTGRVPYGINFNAAVPPASTTKLVTAAAALTWLGPDTVFQTRTLLSTRGTTATVALVGAGDPTLAGPRASLLAYPPVAHLTDLVNATSAALRKRGVNAVRVVVDDRLFAGPRTGDAWKPTYVTDGDASPVTALSVDAGRLRPDNDSKTPDDRAADPTLTAGRDFVALLSRAGVRVVGSVRRAAAPTASEELAAVSSPPVSALVTRMLQRSDNDIAEALFRHIAIARHLPGSFIGGATAIRQYLAGLHVDIRAVQVVDGSGLSLRDRLSPLLLTALLRNVASDGNEVLHPIVGALPVAAFSGTLSSRYRAEPRKILPVAGAGLVRAKTGTLTGVSALAGFAQDADGRLLAFAFVAPNVPLGGLTAAETALDRLAAQLSGCGCR